MMLVAAVADAAGEVAAVSPLQSLVGTNGPIIAIVLVVLLSTLYLLEATAYRSTKLRAALVIVIVPLLVLFGVVVALRMLEAV